MSYNPTLGRWIQRDPAGYVDGANLYEYVGGEPIAFTDPDGLDRGGHSGKGGPFDPSPINGGPSPRPPQPSPPSPRPPEPPVQPEPVSPISPGAEIKLDVITSGDLNLTALSFTTSQSNVCGSLTISRLKNAKITLNTEGTLGWGINKVIVSKIGKGPTDDGFSDAVDQLLSRQSQSIALECPNGKTCCNKKSYDGEYPVSMKFRFELGRDFFGLKKTVVTGTITGRAVINGEIGECK